MPYPCPCIAGDGDGVGLVDVVGGPRDRYVYFAACYVTCLSVFYRNPALKYILTRSCSAHYSSLINDWPLGRIVPALRPGHVCDQTHTNDGVEICKMLWRQR